MALDMEVLRERAYQQRWIVDGGSECRVIQCTENTLYKVYRSLELAQGAMNRQQLAFENGLAPEVKSGMLEFVDDYGNTKWGYMTEKVLTVNDQEYKNTRFKIGRACRYPLSGGARRLADDLIELFGSWCDLRDVNVGIKNNKYVAIDFGMLSVNIHSLEY
jgi:hypothetical protein